MAPSRRSSTQAGEWRRPAQTTFHTRAVYLPNSMLHPIVPGTDVPFVSSQPAPSVPPQAVPTGYIRTPPPPPARHLFAKQKRPQKPSGHVTQPSVLDRVSNRRHILTAEAKPFVGSAHDVPSAAAPAAAREPRDMLSAGSGHSFSQSKLDCLLCGLYTAVCLTRSMPLALVLVCYSTERQARLVQGSQSTFSSCVLAQGCSKI